MTREEAMLLLHDMKDTYDEIHENTNCEIGYEQMTALDMAIEALSADAVQGERGHMMIDGNKLMLALSEWWYSSFGLEETEESKAIHKVMDEVERYVDHEKSADYWIPCSERLPEVGEICLLTVHEYGWNCKEYTRVIIGEYSDNYADHILAWMPLPKPYKGGDDE